MTGGRSQTALARTPGDSLDEKREEKEEESRRTQMRSQSEPFGAFMRYWNSALADDRVDVDGPVVFIFRAPGHALR